MTLDLPPFFQLHEFDQIDSTNDEAKRLAAAGAKAGTLVVARRQTAGRGRQGRSWHSSIGNVHCSLVLRPGRPAGEAAQLSFVTAVAVNDAVGEFLPADVRRAVKWPNDILVRDRKIAGILLESAPDPAGRVEWLVVGVGINVIHGPPQAGVGTSLRDEGGGTASAGAVVAAFARRFLVWMVRWQDDGFEPIRAAWMGLAKGLGQSVEARLVGRIERGLFRGIDAVGALLLEVEGGEIRTISGGEVYFASVPERAGV